MMLLCTLEMLTACFAGSGHSIYKGIPAGILLNPKYLLQCFGSIWNMSNIVYEQNFTGHGVCLQQAHLLIGK